MPDPAIEESFRAFAAARSFSAATIDRWSHLAPADGAAVLSLAQELRLGENQLRDLWDWAEEIAERDRSSISNVLAADSIAAARRRQVGRNDKLKLIKAELRRLRFPQLAATEERLATLIQDLNLPRSVRVTLPEFLEGDTLRVEIVAGSAAALRDAAARLQEAADTATCHAIFALLAEAP